MAVVNRPPNAPTVTVSPNTPIATVDDITCQATANGDPDGQSVTIASYNWTSDFGNVYNGQSYLLVV